jgi:hypothetical protein
MKPKILICSALTALFLTGATGAFAHGEYAKVLHKEFTVNPDAKLIVDNKFGEVHCNNWDKNVVDVEVKVTVDASNQDNAEKIFSKVSIQLKGTAALVEARTMLDDVEMHGKNHLQIDYTVNMPASISLDLTNKFGDVYIDQVDGTSKIELSYGNMEARNFNNSDNMMTINFGDANVKSVKGAVLNLKYSKMEVGYAGSLRIDSKYSDLDAAEIVSLTGNYEGGKLSVGKSGAIDSRTKFSDISVEKLETSLTLDIQYGNCDIDKIGEDFSSVTVNNKYGNVSLGFPVDAAYSLDADMKFCELDFPEDKGNFSYRSITGTSKTYKGTVGKSVKTLPKVYIRSDYGQVSLEQ